MAKPIILVIDDDAEVLRAISRDLSAQYARDYQIIRAASGEEAMTIASELKLKNRPVALMLSDQRMPAMQGVEFLEKAAAIHPKAKRALLTAYADKDTAIQAINTIHLDYYLMKPWDPPEQNLYPVIDDLLSDWQASYLPVFEGVTLIDHRWSAKGYAIRDFLARNHVPYRWLHADQEGEARELIKLSASEERLPLVILADGAEMIDPEISALANACGLKTKTDVPFYDLVIVGGGPAGLAAGVYGAAEGLKTIIIEGDAPGGQAGTSARIENYLGFPKGLSGSELSRRAISQVERLGAELLLARNVTGFRTEGPYRFIALSDGSEIVCHSVIIACGIQYRKLEGPGINELAGAGVYYGAATTEAAGSAGGDVFVVGGGNSAGQAALFLSEFARTVTILIRRDSLTETMSHYLIERIDETPHIHVRPFSQITGVTGEDAIEGVSLRNLQDGSEETLPSVGVFVFIGAEPRTDWLGDAVERDDHGFIVSGSDLVRSGKRPAGWNVDRDPFLTETSLPGVFVAGDVRSGSVKRVASAVGEGSISVSFVHQHLASL